MVNVVRIVRIYVRPALLHFNVCRGIVFPGAAVLRPPLLPVDQHIKVFSSVHVTQFSVLGAGS